MKYLQPRGSGVRLFFPLATLSAVLTSDAPLWSLSRARRRARRGPAPGFPAVGFCGIEAMASGRYRELLSDFDAISLRGARSR